MEIIIRQTYGDRPVEILIAVPGFDGSKWATSEKFVFTMSEAMARRLATALIRHCDGEQPRSQTIME